MCIFSRFLLLELQYNTVCLGHQSGRFKTLRGAQALIFLPALKKNAINPALVRYFVVQFTWTF